MSKLLGSSKFTIRALQLARDRSQLFKSECTGKAMHARFTTVPIWQFKPTSDVKETGVLCQASVLYQCCMLFAGTQSGGGSFDLIVDSETCLETAGNLNSHLPWDIPTSLSSWTLSLDLLHLPEI